MIASMFAYALHLNTVSVGQEAANLLAKGEMIKARSTEADVARENASAEVAKLFEEFGPVTGELDVLWKAVESAYTYFEA